MMVKWIPIERIRPLISYEAFVLVSLLMILAWFFYKIFLKELSARRHGQLTQRFLMTGYFLSLSGLTSSIFWILSLQYNDSELILKISSYFGLITLILGAVTVIKVAQIYVYLYLFFSNMTTGVPRLIGNLFTFVFSTFIAALIGSNVFDFNIATIATTSAVFSLVLGLALQDTLGNFFSGLALQIDRPFQINDWIEIQTGDQKWLGQIHEINWRATYLMTFSDELVMFPNKSIAQSQITILGHAQKPVRLNQMFRFSFDTSTEMAKEVMLSGVQDLPEVMKNPEPLCLITETTDSWITIKIFYSLHDYGVRYRVADKIIQNIIKNARSKDLKFAHQSLIVHTNGLSKL